MIHCVLMGRLGECLASLSSVMDIYQRGEPNFPEEVIKWLQHAEEQMGSQRLPEGAEMSTLRGNIAKAEDELRSKGDADVTRGTVRRARNAAAAEALQRGEEILRSRVLASEERLQHFEEKLCEGMTAFILQAGMPERAGAYDRWLGDIWDAICEFQATRPLTIYIKASLNTYDRHYILDRVVRRVTDEGIKDHYPQ